MRRAAIEPHLISQAQWFIRGDRLPTGQLVCCPDRTDIARTCTGAGSSAGGGRFVAESVVFDLIARNGVPVLANRAIVDEQ